MRDSREVHPVSQSSSEGRARGAWARWVLIALVVGIVGSGVSFACTSEYPGDLIRTDGGGARDASRHQPDAVMATG